ncbi:protein phosphatase Slingshot homolog 1 [Stigmatopora argus]
MALVTLRRSPRPSPSHSPSPSPSASSCERSRGPPCPFGGWAAPPRGPTPAPPARPPVGKKQKKKVCPSLTSSFFPGDLPQHLHLMSKTLRSQDHMKMVAQVESGRSEPVRYVVLVYTGGHPDAEEAAVLGVDIADDRGSCSIGMAMPLMSDTDIRLEGDGSFSVRTAGHSRVFKPVSVQAMWCALQAFHEACEASRRLGYFPGGPSHAWTQFYGSNAWSECWDAAAEPEEPRPESPATFPDRPSETTESLLKAKLREMVAFRDLESVTSEEIRKELEQETASDLRQFKQLIDKEMLVLLGQMAKATPIFDHVYLGSQWSASHLEELRDCGVGYVLNTSPAMENFFPDVFSYHNVGVVDHEDAGDLPARWDDAYNFIAKARKNGSKCLVHCKTGAGSSASAVVAYAMKEYGWSLEKACNFVKHRRGVAQPDAGQLARYREILDASKAHDNTLWRPSADEDVSDDRAGAWGGCGASPCRGLEMEPLDSLNYNYYFRRLSDSALDSEPSTPVRGPPLLGADGVFIEIEDVERDALLEDEGFPVAQLALPAGTGAQTCGAGRLDPLEDMRLRLEFSTLEEEDEEDEEAEMAALEGKKQAEEDSRLGLANLNANNSNRLAAKRSCPAAFDDSAGAGNPLKVKPSYQSCKDCCPRPAPGRRCERPAGARSHRANPSRHCNLPSICIHPPEDFSTARSLGDPLRYGSAVPLSHQKAPETECHMDEPEAEGPLED